MSVLLTDLLSGKGSTVRTVGGKLLNPDGTRVQKGLHGCEGCPLHKKHNQKFINIKTLPGKKALLWGLSPTEDDVETGKMFSGRHFQWFWKELDKLGLSRADFGLQYVVRCQPKLKVDGQWETRDPKPIEYRQCGHHTNRATNANDGEANVWVVVGKATAMQLLRGEWKKSKPVFWSERYQVHVIYLEHPAVYQSKYAAWKLDKFYQRIKAIPFLMENRGRWAYLESSDFKPLYKPRHVAKYLNKLRAISRRGTRISVDIEDGKVEDVHRLLCVGFSHDPTTARTVILHHPQNPYPQYIARNTKLIAEFMEDEQVQKVLHYGSSDQRSLWKLARMRVGGYEYDTTYAHYLKYTFLRSHGLEAIADEHYPLFAGYKDYVSKYTATGNFSNIPLKKMVRYNCADAALTKLLEIDTRDDVNADLLRVYTWAGVTISEMERRGPMFDYKYAEDVVSIVPKRIASLRQELKLITSNPDFNPGANEEVASFLYDHLGMEAVNEKKPRSTDKSTLALLAQHNEHPFIENLLEWRTYEKMDGTYIKRYKESARLNNGELRAKWYLTGAVTGRLRCGGKGDGYEGVINFQNLHGKAFLQNLLVSDVNWRNAVIDRALLDEEFRKEFLEALLDLCVFLAADYSQVEIRMLAEVSGDKLLLKQFKDAAAMSNPSDPRADIHCLVGNLLNPKWTLDFIKGDKPTRTFIKNCHFGMVYGLSPQGLYHYLVAKGVKTTEKKVAIFHKAYFAKYQGVARFIEETRKWAEKKGWVDTIFHFRRKIGKGDYDGDRSTNPMNQAINSPIQGSAHQLLLNVMAILHQNPKDYHLLKHLLAEVHDALIFRVTLGNLQEAYAQGKQLMEQEVATFTKRVFGRQLQVPLLSEFTAGFRYGVQVDYHGESPKKFLLKWNHKNYEVEAETRKKYLEEKEAA